MEARSIQSADASQLSVQQPPMEMSHNLNDMIIQNGSSMLESQNYLDLHELAKGWKSAIVRATNPATRIEAQVKNDRGNLPIHTAASFRAPIEVAEALINAYPEGASQTNNYGNLALHFTAWKKGPLAVEQLLLKIYPEGAGQRNNHGNLPLHYAAHYNAPLEVVEALYDAYPDAAMQKNNDSNTPLDLAIADGASPNVVALLQGKPIPPSDTELLDSSKQRCDIMERELQTYMEQHSSMQENLDAVLSFLMDVKAGHGHSLYSAGINPDCVQDIDSLLDQLQTAAQEDLSESNNPMASRVSVDDEESQAIEDALIPIDDAVEQSLSCVVGMDPIKNHLRGLRRTIEMNESEGLPPHMLFVGNPGTGKTFIARTIMPILHKIGAVKRENFIEVGRDDLIDRKSEARTKLKTQRVLEKAKGGVLFVDEAYTLLPSSARRRSRDHGAVALRELAYRLKDNDPLIIFAGYPDDLNLVMSSDVGFKGSFLLQFELPDPSPLDLAKIFMTKMHTKGFVPADGLSIPLLAEMIDNEIPSSWRLNRNGHICDLLMNGVRMEIKKKLREGDEIPKIKVSPYKNMPAPGSNEIALYPSEELLVTVIDIQNCIRACC